MRARATGPGSTSSLWGGIRSAQSLHFKRNVLPGATPMHRETKRLIQEQCLVQRVIPKGGYDRTTSTGAPGPSWRRCSELAAHPADPFTMSMLCVRRSQRLGQGIAQASIAV